MTDVTITLFADPLSAAAYRGRPTLSRLRYVFDDAAWRYRPLVAVPDEGPSTADPDFSTRDSTTEMPLSEAALGEPLPSSWPVCEAVAAAREAAATDVVFRFVRQLADLTFAAGTPPETVAEIRTAATAVPGFDPESVTAPIGTRRATAAVGRDIGAASRTVASLPDVDVRGTPPIEPLGARSCHDSRDDTGLPEDVDPAVTRVENATFAGPVYRIDSGDRTTVVDGRADYAELRDALRTHDPDLGSSGDTSATRSRNVMQDYGAATHRAEHATGETYDDRIHEVLRRLGSAFVPEVAACLDLTHTTCQVELRGLRADGELEQTGTGAWVRVSEE